ncbi:hypothetical protein Tco_1345431 [Tanacetum coccineum]
MLYHGYLHDMIEKIDGEVFMMTVRSLGITCRNCHSLVGTRCSKGLKTPRSMSKIGKRVILWLRKQANCLGHKISKNRIEVDKAKVDVIAKLPHPTIVKGVWSFLDHAGFYRWLIKDFSKISRPMTHLLEKNTLFIFSDECIQSFETLKKKLTEAPILIAPD